MREEIQNKSSEQLLEDIKERFGLLMNNPIDNHPYYAPVFKELEERLKSWQRIGPRKLKVTNKI